MALPLQYGDNNISDQRLTKDRDSLVDFMDILNLDETVVDEKLDKLLSKNSLSNSQLSVVLSLLQYKYLLCVQEGTDCENEKEFEFVVRHLFKSENDGFNVNILCRVLYFTLLLDKESFHVKVQHLVQQVLSELSFDIEHACGGFSDKDSSIIENRLNAMDAILDACTVNECVIKLHLIEDPLENILYGKINEITIKLLTVIIPKMINIFDGYDILYRVKKVLLERFSIYSDNLVMTDFTILSALVDHFFPMRDQMSEYGMKYSVAVENAFWFFIHNHLSYNSTNKKFATYFAKRAIDSLASFKLDFNPDEEKTYYQVKWSSLRTNSLLKTWENFFVLIEALDENQNHIVQGALPLLSQLNDLQPIWFQCVLRIALGHDNQAVKQNVLQFAFSLMLTEEFGQAAVMIAIIKAINSVIMVQDIEKSKDYMLSFQAFLSRGVNLKIFLDSVNLEDLSTVPSFYLVNTLADIVRENNKSLPKELLSQIFKWRSSISTNNIYLREACQCCFLNALTNLSPEIVDLQFVYSILKFFPSDSVFHRGTTLWNSVSDWISLNFTTVNLLQFTANITNKENLKCTDDIVNAARFFVIVLAIDLKKITYYAEVIIDMLNSIESVRNREYASSIEPDKSYKFIVSFYSELCSEYSDDDYGNDSIRYVIFKMTSHLIPPLLGYLCKQLKTISGNVDINDIDEYINGVNLILRLRIMTFHQLKEKCQSVVSISKLVLRSDRDLTHKYFLSHIMASFALHFLSDYTISEEVKCHEISIIYDAINDSDISRSHTNDMNLKTQSGKLIAGINEAYGKISYCYFNSMTMYNETVCQILYNKAMNQIESGGYGCLIWVLKLMEKLLPLLLANNDALLTTFKSFLQYCWKETLELRKHDKFKPCLQYFIRNIFQHSLLSNNDFKTELITYTDEIFLLGENSSLIPYTLIHHIYESRISVENDLIISIITNCLLYGQVLRKNQRIENETCFFVKNKPSQFPGVEALKYSINIDHDIRILAMRILLHNNNDTLYEKVSENIRKKIDKTFATKVRYHANSLDHRKLLRGLQGLLMMLLLRPECKEQIVTMNWCIAFLSKLPHQPSVKLMFEWYIAACIILSDLHVTLEDSANIGLESLPLISQFVIKYHVVKYRVQLMIQKEDKLDLAFEKNLSDEFNSTVDDLLANTMGQNFGVRLHAQYLSTKLLTLNQMLVNLKKYKYIHKVVQNTLDQNSSEKGLEKLKQDFYINNFDIIKNLTLDAIFFHVPRLTGVASDEIICESEIPTMLNCLESIMKSRPISLESGIPVGDLNPIYSCLILKQMLPNSLSIHVTEKTQETGCLDINNGDNTIIQKKFVPWNDMLSSANVDKSFGIKRKATSKSDLIVIASLIDRLPNLGGLARTCEVFGVSKYVIADKKVIQDKQFQSLSVTAEKWIDIEEVKPGKVLKDYIMEMKNNGYAIVCAEQTSSSVILTSFEFPKKTLLLLGSEREGIPCDLFPLMDYCVEIPQKGLIRSLNVHVSAALFVWEYMKQHKTI